MDTTADPTKYCLDRFGKAKDALSCAGMAGFDYFVVWSSFEFSRKQTCWIGSYEFVGDVEVEQGQTLL